jgi:hypothetical protein
MSNQTVSTNEETMVGGWTPYGPLTPEDKQIFDEATKGFPRVQFTPHSVSTQLVAGMNYRFKCSAMVPPAEVIWEVIVEIFQPLGGGQPYITGIYRV